MTPTRVTIVAGILSMALGIGFVLGAAFGGSAERTRQLSLAQTREIEHNRRLIQVAEQAFHAGQVAQLDAQVKEALGEEVKEPDVRVWLDLPVEQ